MRKQKRLNIQRKVRKFRVTNAVKRHSNRPRLSVFRSAKHIYAQIVDDNEHKTLASASTMDKSFRAQNLYGGNVAAAAVVGKAVAERALAAGVREVCFDRGGHKYHGRVKALADAARQNGLDIGAMAEEEESVPRKGKPAKPAKPDKPAKASKK